MNRRQFKQSMSTEMKSRKHYFLIYLSDMSAAIGQDILALAEKNMPICTERERGQDFTLTSI